MIVKKDLIAKELDSDINQPVGRDYVLINEKELQYTKKVSGNYTRSMVIVGHIPPVLK